MPHTGIVQDLRNKGRLMRIRKFARNGLRPAATSIGMFSLLSGAPVLSQAAASPEASPDDQLQEVVVTARRREESLQDTPVAVTVLTNDMLERMQVTGTTDLDKVAPNLQFHSYGTLTGNNSAAQVFIRGIGQTDATPAVDPGV